MAESRYSNTTILDRRFYATQPAYIDVREDIDVGVINSFIYITKDLDRLDILANRFYGDGRYWWIIAIANDMGWATQLPGGITIRIPSTLESVIERI